MPAKAVKKLAMAEPEEEKAPAMREGVTCKEDPECKRKVNMRMLWLVIIGAALLVAGLVWAMLTTGILDAMLGYLTIPFYLFWVGVAIVVIGIIYWLMGRGRKL